MHDLILKGGSVATVEGVRAVDVAITDGVIAALDEGLSAAGRIIDCTGQWIGPAFVDIHTHLREPGQEWKEDIRSGSAAAAAGGYGAVVAMPNTEPAIDSGHLARFVTEKGAETGLVDVLASGAITMGRDGETMSHIDDLWSAGVRMFTDDGDCVESAAVLRAAMEYIEALGGVVAQHAIDRSLSGSGFMHEGSVSSRLGMHGIPSEADDVTIARDLMLAELTGVKYHVQHLSTRRGVDLVRAAKRSGLSVTAEVTPHHLAFDHGDVASTDANFKMMPPLRTSDDRDALREGLIDGTIDAVATDHAPHAALEKDVPFEQAPNGVLGLEWAASVAVGSCGLDQNTLFDRMSVRPAAIAMIPTHGTLLAVGSSATMTVVDPKEEWTPVTTASKSRNAPYVGTEMVGRVRLTLKSGAITHEVAP
jgi:dihydroorotase